MAEIDSSTAAKPFRGRTRHRQWEQLSRGVYVPRASPLRDLLLGWQLVLPSSAAFTSLTVAEVGGWWLPEAIPHPVFAAVPIGERYPERTGLLVCRHPRPVPVETSVVSHSPPAPKHCSQLHEISDCLIWSSSATQRCVVVTALCGTFGPPLPSAVGELRACVRCCRFSMHEANPPGNR